MLGYQKIDNMLDKAQFVKAVSTEVGFDTTNSVEGAFDKIKEEFEELKGEVDNYQSGRSDSINLQKEMGDLLFAICGLANKLDVKAENCLEMTVDKFVFRTGYVETKLKEHKQDFLNGNLDDMCKWWNEAKNIE